MSNTRSRRSLDDLLLEILSRIFVVLGAKSAKDIVSTRFWMSAFIKAILGLNLLRQAADEHPLEAIYLLGMIYISRGPHQCDEGLQLLDAYFGWAVPDDGEYTSVVDSAKELLRVVDVVHRLTTNNITFQCEDPHHSVKGAFAIGHEEDEDRQRYCMVCRWQPKRIMHNWVKYLPKIVAAVDTIPTVSHLDKSNKGSYSPLLDIMLTILWNN
uniref:Uncharacterized protein n=1 Tax=Lactuca sativa TaxID=4236 RepID=A0A9R1VYR4_LACSA|nr:hypothetical protein LSAT_V11C400189810 [Lactuca sativa]